MVTVRSLRESAVPGEKQTELHVVALYEDFPSGEWAKQVFDHIRNQTPRDMVARPSLWRFDVMQDKHWGALAAGDLAHATVIIVAARGGGPLPKCVLDCIEQALGRSDSSRVGLVAVLESANERVKDTLPVYRQLQAVSRNAKLRFFSLTTANLVATRAQEEPFRFASRGPLDQSLMMKFTSYRGWGIND